MRRRCLALLLTAAVSHADFPLPRLEDVQIDGRLSDWSGSVTRIPLLQPDSILPPDPAASNADARLAWDQAGLLMAVAVVDDSPSESHRASGAYLADSVELFLADGRDGPNSIQIVVSPGTDPRQAVARAYTFDQRSAPLRDLPIACEWSVSQNANGYVVEARLPWAAIGLRPDEGALVAARLYVNNLDSRGLRTRFAWQPKEGAGRFHSLRLVGPTAASYLDRNPVAWLALDPDLPGVRLNLLWDASLGARQVSVSDDTHSDQESVDLAGRPDSSTLSLRLPLSHTHKWTVALQTEAETVRIEVPNTADRLLRSLLERANAGWRLTAEERRLIAFARLQFEDHVFIGDQLPAIRFGDSRKVAAAFGETPRFRTEWFDRDGAAVDRARGPGLYAARTSLTLPGRDAPLVLEHLLYRMPDGATVPSSTDELTARILAFSLSGADATPGHAARVTERWWHHLRRSQQGESPIPYEIRRPAPETQSAGKSPLIVYLHGTGEGGGTAIEEVLDAIGEGAQGRAFVIHPRSIKAWRGPAVLEMIDEVVRLHPVDTSRIYLVGFSMGGIGTWEVALDQPERFAAIVPIGGRMGSPADAHRLARTPVWIFNGAEDPTTTPEEASIMAEALRRAGGDVRMTLLPGAAHGDSKLIALRHPGFWDWLFEQTSAR